MIGRDQADLSKLRVSLEAALTDRTRRQIERESLQKKRDSLLRELGAAEKQLAQAADKRETARQRNDGRRWLAAQDIDSMTGDEFEKFLRAVFELLGFEVEMTRHTDQGGDLIIRKNGRKTCIQAKRWRGSVGNDAVQEAFAGMGFYKCDACAVITSSRFTRPAKNLAMAIGCTLVEGNRIPALIDGTIAV